MKRKLLSILLVLMLVCFAFPIATAFATEQPEPVSTKTIVAGTDFTLDVSEGSINLDGFILGKSVGYGGTPNKAFVTIKRGESVVLKFNEVIELTQYDTLTLSITKKISSQVVYEFYKNSSTETAPKQTVTMTDAQDVIEKVTVDLSDYVVNGKVESIVIKHLSDGAETEVDTFQLLVYDSELSLLHPPVTDKNLVAGTDFTISTNTQDFVIENLSPAAAAGYGGTPNKAWINILRGKSVVMKFAEPVDVNVYDRLIIGVSKNISANALFSFYKNESGETTAKETVTCKTNAVSQTAVLSLKNFADSEGKVSSLVFEHTSDERAEGEYDNFQAFIYDSVLLPVGGGMSLIAKSDFVLSTDSNDAKISDVTLGSSVGYGGTPNKGFVTVKRGESVVLKFNSPVDINEFNTFSIQISKNITSNATFAFYKNASGETAPKLQVVCNTLSSAQQVNLFLEDYAVNGIVESIVIKHVSDGVATEVENFQLFVYDSALTIAKEEEPADYKVKISDMKDGDVSIAGTEKKTLFPSQATGKMYCNNFTMNSVTTLGFINPINTRYYKTLSLNVKISNLTLAYNFYFELYKTSATDIATATPAGRIVVKSDGNSANYEIDLTAFADENGMVDGIVFYHLKNTRLSDYVNTSFWIFESNVYMRQAKTKEFEWSTEIESAEYINNFDDEGNNKLVLTFDRKPFTELETTIADEEMINQLAREIMVNGRYLSSTNGLKQYIVGYNGDSSKLALVFSEELYGNGNDGIIINKNAKIQLGGTIYTFTNDYDYVIMFEEDNVFYPVREVGKVLSVVVQTEQLTTAISVRFSREIGDIDCVGASVLTSLYIDGVKASEIDGATASKHATDENVLVITLPSTATTIKIGTGFTTEKIYVFADATYNQYTANDPVWHYQNGKALEILGFENYYSESVFVKFTLKTNINAGTMLVDISNSSALGKIKFNLVSLADIAKRGEISVLISGQYIEFIVERGVATINQDAQDVIIIEQGFGLPTGGVTASTKYFGYNQTEKTFELLDGAPQPETPPQENAGCNGSISQVGISLVILILAVAGIKVFARITKKEN